MRYFLAIVLPPVAVLFCGRPFLAILNAFLCLFFWIPGALHACLVVHEHLADQRERRLAKELKPAHA
jgi:uncharacterized membrane protein YqaE (UPF0057 family)